MTNIPRISEVCNDACREMSEDTNIEKQIKAHQLPREFQL